MMRKTVTIEDLELEIERMKKQMSRKDWIFFRKKPITCVVNGEIASLEFTAICGQHLQYGLEPVLQGLTTGKKIV